MADNVSTSIFIIAHAPLASALKNCAMHVYSYDDRTGERIEACDVPADGNAEEIAAALRAKIDASVKAAKPVILFTDIVGATPSNIAVSLASDEAVVVSGVNLPMVLTALCHLDEPFEDLIDMVRKAGLVSICPEKA